MFGTARDLSVDFSNRAETYLERRGLKFGIPVHRKSLKSELCGSSYGHFDGKYLMEDIGVREIISVRHSPRPQC